MRRVVSGPAGAAALTGYLAVQWLGRTWGATRQERHRRLPGDRLTHHPLAVTTHAITVNAPPNQIWPWLAQMGWRRGGWYTAEWVDRLLFPANGPSADHIMAEMQSIRPGDTIPDGPPEAGCEFTVADLKENQHLILHSEDHLPPGWKQRYSAWINWTWAFVLDDLGNGKTRFIVRSRLRAGPWWVAAVYLLAIIPADFVMSRQMLHGVKTRAERAGGRNAVIGIPALWPFSDVVHQAGSWWPRAARLCGWLIGGNEMTDRKGAFPETRSRAAPTVVSPRNKVNVALPFSRFTVQESVNMTVGDWISLAGLAISVTGFSVVIWHFIRAANGSHAIQRPLSERSQADWLGPGPRAPASVAAFMTPGRSSGRMIAVMSFIALTTPPSAGPPPAPCLRWPHRISLLPDWPATEQGSRGERPEPSGPRSRPDVQRQQRSRDLRSSPRSRPRNGHGSVTYPFRPIHRKHFSKANFIACACGPFVAEVPG